MEHGGTLYTLWKDKYLYMSYDGEYRHLNGLKTQIPTVSEILTLDTSNSISKNFDIEEYGGMVYPFKSYVDDDENDIINGRSSIEFFFKMLIKRLVETKGNGIPVVLDVHNFHTISLLFLMKNNDYMVYFMDSHGCGNTKDSDYVDFIKIVSHDKEEIVKQLFNYITNKYSIDRPCTLPQEDPLISQEEEEDEKKDYRFHYEAKYGYSATIFLCNKS